MDKSGNRADKISYRIERATITRADPGKHDKPYQVEVWRIVCVEERYFHYDTEEDARDVLKIFMSSSS